MGLDTAPNATRAPTRVNGKPNRAKANTYAERERQRAMGHGRCMRIPSTHANGWHSGPQFLAGAMETAVMV